MKKIIFLGLISMMLGCDAPSAPPAERSSSGSTSGSTRKISAEITDGVTGTVTVEIDSSGQTQTIVLDQVPQGETVETLMRQITDCKVVITGSGTTAFVQQIGDQATGSSEGWTYTIDGQRANRGIGSTTLTPPATVKWNYGAYSDAAATEAKN